jgi:hypothetical protein
MKHRALVLIAVLFGAHFAPHVARADFVAPPGTGPRTYNYHNPQGKDVSASWNAEGAGNPDGLTPTPGTDSTNSTVLKGFSESHLDSLFGASSVPATAPVHGNTEIDITKPIEKVEPHVEVAKYDAQPTPIVPRKSDSKRVVLVAFASVAILAYRKFRRSRAKVPWQKPSFL